MNKNVWQVMKYWEKWRYFCSLGSQRAARLLNRFPAELRLSTKTVGKGESIQQPVIYGNAVVIMKFVGRTESTQAHSLCIPIIAGMNWYSSIDFNLLWYFALSLSSTWLFVIRFSQVNRIFSK